MSFRLRHYRNHPLHQRHCYHRREFEFSTYTRFLFFSSRQKDLKLSFTLETPLHSPSKCNWSANFSNATLFSLDKNLERENEFEDYLAEDGEIYQKTLRLVECAMFAAVSGLAFLLCNSLAIEKYFACFFALPIVLSTMRWGVAAGRKTMVATTVLLFVLSGPVKAMTYLHKAVLILIYVLGQLLHGLLGFTMGTIWRMKVSWGTSVVLCSVVRALGALVNVLIGSYLIGENILALITINVHALLTFALSSVGIISVLSMNLIYIIFGVLLLFNCASFVFLLHILYAVFFTRLGIKASLRLPKWLEAAI